MAAPFPYSPHSPATPGYTDHDTPKLSQSQSYVAVDHDDKDEEMVVKEKKHHATEVIETTRARRWWLRLTWAFTWWVPSFMLSKMGGMKRADIRMAWREKLAICMMVFLLCGLIIFYIVVFGKLLCPDSDKAWNLSELATHAGEDDYYAAIAGKVYDVSLQRRRELMS